MKAGIFSTNMNFSEMLMTEFLLHGVTFYFVKDSKEIYKRVLEQDLDLVCLDVDSTGINWLEMIRFLKRNPKTATIHIMIITTSDEDAFLRPMVMEGINAVFHTTDPPMTSYVKKIEAIVDLFEQEINNKRKYIRVSPEKNEKIPVKLKSTAHAGIILGEVIDLSVIAAAIKFNQTAYADLISEDAEVTEMILEIDGIPYSTAGRVVRKLENGVVVDYTRRNHFFTHGIITYILNKINY
jgi:CheY-like chemotaxis protein